MIDKEVLKEVFREAFQDFDLRDYDYSLKFHIGIRETNSNGSLKRASFYNNYKDFYKDRVGKKIKVTYKYYISLYLNFKHNGIVNTIEFNEFLEDSITKLNYLLERDSIIFLTCRSNISSKVEIPIENVEEICKDVSYLKDSNMFCLNCFLYGEELQLPIKPKPKMYVFNLIWTFPKRVLC